MRHTLLVLTMLAAALAAGCGKKGDLYLPEPEQAEQQEESGS